MVNIPDTYFFILNVCITTADMPLGLITHLLQIRIETDLENLHPDLCQNT